MTREEAAALGLEPYVDYYEFGDDGSCLSLRDGSLIGNSGGGVTLSGLKYSATVRLIKIIAAMYLGLRNFKDIKLLNIDGDALNNAASNIRIMSMNEWLAEKKNDKKESTKRKAEHIPVRYYRTRQFKQRAIQEWCRNNT